MRTQVGSAAAAYGGSTDASLHADKELAELWVEDRGPGIPAAERAHVFKPFNRLEASRNRESGGVGLRLTIVRQIVESTGGAVYDRSPSGRRLRMRMRACVCH